MTKFLSLLLVQAFAANYALALDTPAPDYIEDAQYAAVLYNRSTTFNDFVARLGVDKKQTDTISGYLTAQGLTNKKLPSIDFKTEDLKFFVAAFGGHKLGFNRKDKLFFFNGKALNVSDKSFESIKRELEQTAKPDALAIGAFTVFLYGVLSVSDSSPQPASGALSNRLIGALGITKFLCKGILPLEISGTKMKAGAAKFTYDSEKYLATVSMATPACTIQFKAGFFSSISQNDQCKKLLEAHVGEAARLGIAPYKVQTFLNGIGIQGFQSIETCCTDTVCKQDMERTMPTPTPSPTPGKAVGKPALTK